MRPIPLLVPASRDLSDEVLRDLRDSVHRRCGAFLAPVRVASAALLPAVLEQARDVLAWAPPCIASTLVTLGLAAPLVAAPRRDQRTRSAVLVTRPGIEGLGDFAGRRVGWVSRLSETGYEVPRLYLESFGVEPSELFANQRFYGTHDAVAAALVGGEVDVIATHSGRLRHLFTRTPMRVAISVGPLPSDLVVAGLDVPDAAREQVADALVSCTAPRTGAFTSGAHVFAPAREGHLGLFDLLGRQRRESWGFVAATPGPAGSETAERLRPSRFAS
jgi:ABC-type phosphate/phosphonate transport system substrate-binding protein